MEQWQNSLACFGSWRFVAECSSQRPAGLQCSSVPGVDILLAGCSQERVASGELEGAAGMLPMAATVGGLNWSELYAIVGSLFETNISVPHHLAMLDHLPREQRCVIASVYPSLCLKLLAATSDTAV